MGEPGSFDFDHHKALQQPIVKYEVNKKFIAFKMDAFLPGHKSERRPLKPLPNSSKNSCKCTLLDIFMNQDRYRHFMDTNFTK